MEIRAGMSAAVLSLAAFLAGLALGVFPALVHADQACPAGSNVADKDCPIGSTYDYTCPAGQKDTKHPDQVCEQGKPVKTVQVEAKCMAPCVAKATCYFQGSTCESFNSEGAGPSGSQGSQEPQDNTTSGSAAAPAAGTSVSANASGASGANALVPPPNSLTSGDSLLSPQTTLGANQAQPGPLQNFGNYVSSSLGLGNLFGSAPPSSSAAQGSDDSGQLQGSALPGAGVVQTTQEPGAGLLPGALSPSTFTPTPTDENGNPLSAQQYNQQLAQQTETFQPSGASAEASNSCDNWYCPYVQAVKDAVADVVTGAQNLATDAENLGAAALNDVTNSELTSSADAKPFVNTTGNESENASWPGGSSEYLIEQRAALMDQLNTDPGLRDLVSAVLVSETADPRITQDVLEAWVNRCLSEPNCTSLYQDTTNKFFQPVNNGTVTNLLTSGLSQDQIDRANNAMAAVAGGSDDIAMRTDQGYASTVAANGRITVPNITNPSDNESFGYMNGNSTWSNQQLAAKAAYDAAYTPPAASPAEEPVATASVVPSDVAPPESPPSVVTANAGSGLWSTISGWGNALATTLGFGTSAPAPTDEGGTVNGSAPTPADAATAEPAPTPAPVGAAFGDSTARQVQLTGSLGGATQDSAQPSAVTNMINNSVAQGTDLAGQSVVIGTGCANNPNLCINNPQIIEDQIKGVQAMGGTPILLPVGPGAAAPDLVARVNDTLQDIAQDNGAQFIQQNQITWNAGGDNYHLSNPSDVLGVANTVGNDEVTRGISPASPAPAAFTPAYWNQWAQQNANLVNQVGAQLAVYLNPSAVPPASPAAPSAAAPSAPSAPSSESSGGEESGNGGSGGSSPQMPQIPPIPPQQPQQPAQPTAACQSTPQPASACASGWQAQFDPTGTCVTGWICGGGSGSTPAASSQVVNPSIVLVANPGTVQSGHNSLIGWVTSGMQSCVVSSAQDTAFTAENASFIGVDGTASTSPLTTTTNYTLTCQEVGGGVKSAMTSVGVQ